MTSPLAPYTRSAFEQGPPGASSESIFDQLGTSVDTLKNIGIQKEQEAQRKANNISAADLMKLGSTPEELEAGRKAYFDKISGDPNVDVNAAMKNFDDLLTGMVSREKDASEIKTDTDTLDTNALTRKLTEYNLNRAKVGADRADTAYAKTQVLEQASEDFNKWYSDDNGGFHQAALDEVLPAVARLGYTGEKRERAIAKAVEQWKGDKMQDPDWIPNHAREMGLPDEAFAEINQVGKELAEIRRMAAASAIENSEKRLKGESVQDDFKRDFAFNGNSGTLGWDGTKYTHGKQSSNMNDGRGLRYAEKEGMEVEDETTKQALEFLKDQFPSESAYKHVLDIVRGPERKKTLTRTDMQIIADQRNNLMSDVADELNEKDTADNPGGTWLENLEFNSAATQSQQFKKVEIPPDPTLTPTDPALMTTEQFNEALKRRVEERKQNFTTTADTLAEDVKKILATENGLGFGVKWEARGIQQKMDFLATQIKAGSSDPQNLYFQQQQLVDQMKALQDRVLENRKTALK